MKNCRNCKTKYKESYSFCPKCGTPYDKKMKRAKIPTYKINNVGKIVDIVLYVIAGLIAFTYIMSFTENILESIIAILFSLSLFKIFYIMVENKFNTIDEKYIKIVRIVLPIVLLVVWSACFPAPETDNFNTQTNDIMINETKEEHEKSQDDIEKTENNNVQKKVKEEVKEETKVVSYELKYKLLGDFGKLVEYEGEKEYFYYFPSGTYEIEVTKASNVCFLWIDYNEGYNNPPYGTAYNNKQKLQFTKKGEKQTVILTDDVHIYNSNDCNYKLIKKD